MLLINLIQVPDSEFQNYDRKGLSIDLMMFQRVVTKTTLQVVSSRKWNKFLTESLRA